MPKRSGDYLQKVLLRLAELAEQGHLEIASGDIWKGRDSLLPASLGDFKITLFFRSTPELEELFDQLVRERDE
jgi:hypothetical protein